MVSRISRMSIIYLFLFRGFPVFGLERFSRSLTRGDTRSRLRRRAIVLAHSRAGSAGRTAVYVPALLIDFVTKVVAVIVTWSAISMWPMMRAAPPIAQ